MSDSVTGGWDVGTLGLGATVTLDVSAVVLSAGEHTYFAEVTAVDQNDPDSTPNDGTGDDLAQVSLAPSAMTNAVIFEDDDVHGRPWI